MMEQLEKGGGDPMDSFSN